MNLSQALAIAEKNLGGEMRSSAEVGIYDAYVLIDKGLYDAAWGRILTSLRYSVGVFHKDYTFVKESYDLEMQAMEI